MSLGFRFCGLRFGVCEGQGFRAILGLRLQNVVEGLAKA